MRVDLKGINTVRHLAADGTPKVYYYHRASGKRLDGEPGTAEFLASFREAGTSAAKARSEGTVSWLIREYCQSQQWKKLADSTRAIGRLNLNAVEAKWGEDPVSSTPRTQRAGRFSCDGTINWRRRSPAQPTTSSQR